MLDGRRAVVIGGDGFIGRYIVNRLAQAGVTVIVAARRARQARYLLPMGAPGQIVLADVSIADETALAALIAGADIVINLVGILHEGGRQSFEAVQHRGAGTIARLAAEAGIDRLVHLSAIGADAASPSRYARSKAEGEAVLRAAFPAATILRPSIVFGAEDKFFNRFAEMAVRFRVLPLIGGGTARFQPVYVGDVAATVLAALASPESRGRTYELGGPDILSFRDLMILLRKALGGRALLLPIPWRVAEIQAVFAEHLPEPPLTRDQLVLLRRDNIVAAGALTLGDLGIAPTALGAILPEILKRFHRND